MGPSIFGLDQSYTEGELRELWLRLEMFDVQVKRLSLGLGMVM